MADYETKHRYQVQGSAALQPEEEPKSGRKPEKKKKRRILPRSAVSILPVAYVGLVVFSCICILTFSTMYIHEKTVLTSLNKELSAAQSELQKLKQENQDLFNEITGELSLESLAEKASELGMVPADKVIRYDQSDSEYVRQKEDIPNE